MQLKWNLIYLMQPKWAINLCTFIQAWYKLHICPIEHPTWQSLCFTSKTNVKYLIPNYVNRIVLTVHNIYSCVVFKLIARIPLQAQCHYIDTARALLSAGKTHGAHTDLHFLSMFVSPFKCFGSSHKFVNFMRNTQNLHSVSLIMLPFR